MLNVSIWVDWNMSPKKLLTTIQFFLDSKLLPFSKKYLREDFVLKTKNMRKQALNHHHYITKEFTWDFCGNLSRAFKEILITTQWNTKVIKFGIIVTAKLMFICNQNHCSSNILFHVLQLRTLPNKLSANWGSIPVRRLIGTQWQHLQTANWFQFCVQFPNCLYVVPARKAIQNLKLANPQLLLSAVCTRRPCYSVRHDSWDNTLGYCHFQPDCDAEIICRK